MDREIIEIQNKILTKLGNDNGVTIHFDEKRNERIGKADMWNMNAYTYNPKTKGVFLMCDADEPYRLSCYKKIMDYIDVIYKCMDDPKLYAVETDDRPWTVEWSFDGGKTMTSYFHAPSPERVLSKFYTGKEALKDKYNILSLKQNPIS